MTMIEAADAIVDNVNLASSEPEFDPPEVDPTEACVHATLAKARFSAITPGGGRLAVSELVGLTGLPRPQVERALAQLAIRGRAERLLDWRTSGIRAVWGVARGQG